MIIEFTDDGYAVVRIDAIFASGYSVYKIDGETMTKISKPNGWFSSEDTAKLCGEFISLSSSDDVGSCFIEGGSFRFGE
jgi:hypothetical protein